MVSTTMVADEQTSDLFNLFVAVRDKGGYASVSKNDLWDLVAKESGLGSVISSTLKVLYIKYLNALYRCLVKVVENKDSIYGFNRNGSGTGFGENMIELQAGFNGLLSEVEFLKKNDELHEHTKLRHKLNFWDHENEIVAVKIDGDKNITGCGEVFCNSRKRELDVHNTKNLCKGEDPITKLAPNLDNSVIEAPGSINFRKYGNVSEDKVETSVELSNRGRKCDNCDPDNKEGVILDSTFVKEQNFSHEGKHESILGMVKWITGIAKDPCDPVIRFLPERSKWKSCGNEDIWKQVLLVREAMLLKRHISSYAAQSAPQKIHPCMFDEHRCSSYNLRVRLKSSKVLPSGKSMSQALSERTFGPSLMLGMEDQLHQEMLVTTDSWMPDYMGKYASKRIPLGPIFQVEVPEWSSIVSESDPKWLGTLVWPLDKVNQVFLIEYDFIGKGRQDSCECQVPGSTECIQYHIAEKRYKVKMELGSAFDQWKFDRMGEEVTLCWTKKEEHKFKDAVRSSSASLRNSFWTRIFKFFSSKSREDLICYYFNVFLLRRRGFQNRFTPDNICSDDEELDFESENPD